MEQWNWMSAHQHCVLGLSKASRLRIGGCVMFDYDYMCKMKPKGRLGVYCRNDVLHMIDSCILITSFIILFTVWRAAEQWKFTIAASGHTGSGWREADGDWSSWPQRFSFRCLPLVSVPPSVSTTLNSSTILTMTQWACHSSQHWTGLCSLVQVGFSSSWLSFFLFFVFFVCGNFIFGLFVGSHNGVLLVQKLRTRLGGAQFYQRFPHCKAWSGKIALYNKWTCFAYCQRL